MNIIFAGTPEFASRHLEILLNSNMKISCVLTQPDRVSGRGKRVTYSPVKQLALDNGLKLLQPSSLKDDGIAQEIKFLKPDIMLVVAYGLIVPKEILGIPEIACINVHGSILPKWRGASPMEYSILNGDKKTGLSYMQMTEGLDEGPVYDIHECPIEPNDRLKDVEKKLIELSENNLIKFLKSINKGDVDATPQKDKNATFAPKILKKDLQIDWGNITSKDLVKRVNSLADKYGVHTYLGTKRIKIFDVSETKTSYSLSPGDINISNGRIIVCCKAKTYVEINTLQMEGKNLVSCKEFLSAYKDLIKNSQKFNYKPH